MTDFPPPTPEELAVPPQEKRWGFLLVAFVLGLIVPLIGLPLVLPSRTRAQVQAEAVKAGHAVYKVIDEFGRTQFEWLPVKDAPVQGQK